MRLGGGVQAAGTPVAATRAAAPAEPIDTADPDGRRALLDLLFRMPIGVAQFDSEGRIGLINPRGRDLLKPFAKGDEPRNVFALFRDRCPDLQRQVAAFEPAEGMILDQHALHCSIDGRPAVVSLTINRLQPGLHLAMLRDVTRLTEMMAYAFASADLLIDVDEGGRIGWASGAFRTLLGIRPEEAVGRLFSSLVSQADRDRLDGAFALMTTTGRLRPTVLRLSGKGSREGVVSGIAIEGAGRRFLVTVGPMPVQEPSEGQGVVLQGDFARKAERALREGEATTLGLLDVHGWDDAARQLDPSGLNHLRERIGSIGTMDGEDLVLGEIGEGRFGVLAQPETDLERIAGLLGQMVESVAGSRVQVEGRRVSLENTGMPLQQSLNALRLVLARFGSQGASACGGLAEGLVGILQTAREHRKALSTIIASRRFNLVFQPIVSLKDSSVHHVEALIRPAFGPFNPARDPGEFVQMIESVGLARDLDLAVLERAVEMLKRSRTPVAVNLSAMSLDDAAFLRQVLAQVAKAPRGMLLIEMTETAEIHDMRQVAEAIDRIRAAGVPICLDDFGAGNAAFRSVRDLRFDCLKIDGSYVRSAGRNEQGRALIRAMRELATSNGATTVAEQVETAEDAELMQSLGIDYGQGWLYGPGRPSPDAVAPKQAALRRG